MFIIRGVSLIRSILQTLFVFDEIIVELKAVNKLSDVHYAQVLNYLKAKGKRVGLLVNFGAKSLEYKRVIL